MIHVYTSFDFKKTQHLLPEGCVLCPEALLTGKQIQEYVDSLIEDNGLFNENKDIHIATCSLYLLRDMDIKDISAIFHNFREDGSEATGNTIDDVGSLEILDRELEQADRYINKEYNVRP